MPRWAFALGLVVATGAALRAERAVNHGAFLSTDERAYAALGRALSHGYYDVRGMNDPLHWPPGTPLLFAVARKLTGVHDAVLAPAAAYWAQAIVGVALIIAVFALVRLLAGPWPGGVAGGGVPGRGRGGVRRALPAAARDHGRHGVRAARRADDRARSARARVGVADAPVVAFRGRRRFLRHRDPRARRPPHPAARARRGRGAHAAAHGRAARAARRRRVPARGRDRPRAGGPGPA